MVECNISNLGLDTVDHPSRHFMVLSSSICKRESLQSVVAALQSAAEFRCGSPSLFLTSDFTRFINENDLSFSTLPAGMHSRT